MTPLEITDEKDPDIVRIIADRLPWGILGPMAFLIIAVCLVPFCPDADKGKLIFLIAGAALTRVKFSPINLKEKP